MLDVNNQYFDGYSIADSSYLVCPDSFDLLPSIYCGIIGVLPASMRKAKKVLGVRQ